MEKYICDECGWAGLKSQLLYNLNPFDESITISACPCCKILNSTVSIACDTLNCWDPATCGTPTNNGYRKTCGKHRPGWEAKDT